MTASGVEEKVREILQRVGKLAPGFSGTADIFRELGVKSAAALDLLLSLEEEFGITIADDAFGEARTTVRLVEMINELKGAAV